MKIVFAILAAVLLFTLLAQYIENEEKQKRIAALLKDNKYLRAALQNKAKNAAEMYGDILIMEKAIQAAQKESERLKDENELLKTHLNTKTQLLEQLQRGVFNG